MQCKAKIEIVAMLCQTRLLSQLPEAEPRSELLFSMWTRDTFAPAPLHQCQGFSVTAGFSAAPSRLAGCSRVSHH